MDYMKLPDDVMEICDVYLQVLKHILGAKLHGAYLYGATTFPETEHTGDLDFHVIVSERLTDDEKSAICRMHDEMEVAYPKYGELDSYYLHLDDLADTAPQHQVVDRVRDESWALHRAHMLAGRVHVLYGPQPSYVFQKPLWDELDSALCHELDYVDNHLDEYPHYCVMNLCRILHSYETRDVVKSKAGSGMWALEKFPEWAYLIDAARRGYAGTASDDDWQMMRAEIGGFRDFMVERMSE